MSVPREPIVLAELNDGVEAEFPGSDVERTALYGMVTTYQELGQQDGDRVIDRRLSDQLPGHTVIQGAVGSPAADIGISIAPGVGTLESFRWEQMTKQRPALVARVDFQGCPLSPISAHRPTKQHPDQRAEFDVALARVVHAERDAGRLPYVGIDANDDDPVDLEQATGLTWWAPFESSICGLLLPTRCTRLAITQLAKRGEHAPVVGLVRVPLLNAVAA